MAGYPSLSMLPTCITHRFSRNQRARSAWAGPSCSASRRCPPSPADGEPGAAASAQRGGWRGVLLRGREEDKRGEEPLGAMHSDNIAGYGKARLDTRRGSSPITALCSCPGLPGVEDTNALTWRAQVAQGPDGRTGYTRARQHTTPSLRGNLPVRSKRVGWHFLMRQRASWGSGGTGSPSAPGACGGNSGT